MKLDLKTGFNLVCIAPGHKAKTAFRYKYGLYKYTVMPIGLINAPATFQAIINHIFIDLIDKGILVYLNDIFIYAKIQKKHNKLVKKVLRRLTKFNLAVILAKYK